MAPSKVGPARGAGPEACGRLGNYAATGAWGGRRSGLVAPIDAIAAAALLAAHFPGTARDVLPLMAPRAHEMGLVDDAPRLGPLGADFERIFGHAHLDAVDVEHHPGLAGLFHHPVPRPAPQAFVLGAISPAASPPHAGHTCHSGSSVVRSRTSTTIAPCGPTRYMDTSHAISTAALRKNSA